jgi:maltooligosyltrehalose synthase
MGAEVWHDTRVKLDDLAAGPWTNLFTAQPCHAGGPDLALSAALADFPVCLLVNTTIPP